jgi:hypothetical protein
MATDAAAGSGSRSRAWVLAALGVALVVLWSVNWLGGSARPADSASNPGRPPQTAVRESPDAGALDVRLEALNAQRPGPDDQGRNPFRFQPKPPPPPPPQAPPSQTLTLPPAPIDVVPPGPPPITLKFIGIIEAPGVGKLAALSDCRYTFRGREGEVIEGRYRLVKIGIESVTMEYLDGRGRTTIRLTGQGCDGKSP